MISYDFKIQTGCSLVSVLILRITRAERLASVPGVTTGWLLQKHVKNTPLLLVMVV